MDSGVIHKMKLQEAYDLVHNKNDGLRINAGFQRQLMELESQVHKENSVDFFDKKARRGGDRSASTTVEPKDKPTTATTPKRRLRKANKPEAPTEDVLPVEPTDLDPVNTTTISTQEHATPITMPQDALEPNKPSDEVHMPDVPPLAKDVADSSITHDNSSIPAVALDNNVEEAKKESQATDNDDIAQRKRKIEADGEENKENEGDSNSIAHHVEKKRKQKESSTTPSKRNLGTPSKDKKAAQKNTLFNYFKV
jgi:hypothetical protein